VAKTSRQVTGVGFVFLLKKLPNKVLDAEPPIASFLKPMLIGGGPVNAAVMRLMLLQIIPNVIVHTRRL
jgi:hypothetical protein